MLTIEQKHRNAPLLLEDALDHAREAGAKLLVNSRSGRGAVQIGARSVMLDDGSIEKRVRLIRPMERTNIPREAMAQTHWEESDPAAFASAWDAEVADVPEFVTSSLHIVTGLLLPIWKSLPNESSRVYRLQADTGERIVGRRVSPAWVAATLGAKAPTLTPAQAWPILMAGEASLHIAEGQILARVRSMGTPRIELTGFNDLGVERLKALGLISEIISWKLRLFVPTGTDGPQIFAKLIERFPITRVVDRRGNAQAA